jgi:hypothetical protein
MRWVLSGVFSLPPLGLVGAPILPPVRPPPNGLPVVVDMEGGVHGVKGAWRWLVRVGLMSGVAAIRV